MTKRLTASHHTHTDTHTQPASQDKAAVRLHRQCFLLTYEIWLPKKIIPQKHDDKFPATFRRSTFVPSDEQEGKNWV